jgi:hypothetical protein
MFNAHKHAESRGLQYSGTISVVGDFDTTYKHNLLAPAHVNVSLYCFPNSKATFQVDKDTLHLDYFEMDKLKKTQVFTILSLLIFLEFNFYKKTTISTRTNVQHSPNFLEQIIQNLWTSKKETSSNY